MSAFTATLLTIFVFACLIIVISQGVLGRETDSIFDEQAIEQMKEHSNLERKLETGHIPADIRNGKKRSYIPGMMVNSDPEELTSAKPIAKAHEWELQKAYQLGLLHGINAQSMAQVKNDVMAFDDYGWEADE